MAVCNLTIIYDVTRLVANESQEILTGIDRVDLKHASEIVFSRENVIGFVLKNAKNFKLVKQSEIKALLDLYEMKQRGMQQSQIVEQRMARGGTIHSMVEKYPNFRTWIGIIMRLWGWLREIAGVENIEEQVKVLNSCGQRFVYFNISHPNVKSLGILETFREIADVKFVFYLYDLIPMDHPEFVREGDAEKHARRVLAMAQYGDLILISSNYIKERFESFCERNNLTAPRVKVNPIGVADALRNTCVCGSNVNILSELTDGVGYFVTVGTIEPRKNHRLLLDVWDRLAGQLGKRCPKLVIVGRRGWKVRELTKRLDRLAVRGGPVIERNDVGDAELVSLLQCARAVLQPSFVEGWGMPVAEAMTVGVPVVCSDIPAHRECAQGLAEFLSPHDPEVWYRAVWRFMHEPDAVETALARQADFVPWSWENHFRELDAALEELLEQPRAAAE